jgi:NADH dehydrogenase
MSSTDSAADAAQAEAPHVVVVGAGFAGVACAKKLGKHGVAVTLIDKNTYHQFQPLLYQVATAQLSGGDIMRPLRGLFRKIPSVAVKDAAVTAVDPVTRTITTAAGQTFKGTHLVLAMGTRPNFFGVPGAPEHTLPLSSTVRRAPPSAISVIPSNSGFPTLRCTRRASSSNSSASTSCPRCLTMIARLVSAIPR